MIPYKDSAMAQTFTTYEKADRMADRIAADDTEWRYGVKRITADRFVIQIFDEDGFLLGYL